MNERVIAHSAEARHARTPLRPRGARITLWTILGVILVLVAAACWVGLRGLAAKAELEVALPLASTIQEQIGNGDSSGARSTYRSLENHTAAAARLTGGPVWGAAEVVPWIGPNLEAMRELASVVHSVTDGAIKPLTMAAGSITVDAFKPTGGAIDVAPLEKVRPQLQAANAAAQRALEQVRAIDTSGTITQVRDATARLEKLLTSASEGIGAATRAAELIPPMLGASGPRNYLLLFQNPAELRATGGIPGAVALVHTENGKISLAQQASSADFPHYTPSVLELPLETRGLYGNIVGAYLQDVTMTPYFPLSGQLAREMWKRQYGTEVDGVLSMDPVTLSYLLRATGPITLPTGDTLTSDNAVKLLLSDVYARYKIPAQQDLFFAGAAAAVFTKVSSGDLDPIKLIAALAQAGSEHRLLLWSAHPDEQAVLAGTTLTGDLPASDAATQRFGIYFNDATGAKMDYYLDTQVAVGQMVCRKDQRPTYRAEVTLTNTAPTDAATRLPPYVTGAGAFGVDPGRVRTQVAVYGPKGSGFLGSASDNKPFPLHSALDSGYPVAQFTAELGPGESKTVIVDMLGNVPFTGDLRVQKTPTIGEDTTGALAMTCESALE